MEIITIANQKGGCGKTMTAINIAGALAGTGQKVLLIDLDPQSHASSALGIEEHEATKSAYKIFDSFLNQKPVDILSLTKYKYQNLWVISAHIFLSTIEQKMSLVKDAVLAITNTLNAAKNNFDYIIIDTPPNLGFLTLNALHAASRVIVPLDVSVFSLNGVFQLDAMLELARGMGFAKPKMNFLITLFDGRSNFAKNFLQTAKERFNHRLLQTVIRANIKLREAAQAGKMIFEYAPSSNGAKDYMAVAAEIAPKIKDRSFEISAPVVLDVETTNTMFKIYAPAAKSVYVVGSFNGWSVDKNSLMKKHDSGTWIKTLPVSKGMHYYKFKVDDKWVEDPENSFSESDKFGGKNSVLLIQA